MYAIKIFYVKSHLLYVKWYLYGKIFFIYEPFRLFCFKMANIIRLKKLIHNFP